jgi:hypothetical protein
MAIEEMLELLPHRPRARILVLARSSLIETTWRAQMEEHAPDLPYVLLSSPRKHRLAALKAEGGPVVFVHSHEDLPAFGKTLAGFEWDMIVIDETSRFRTASAQRVGRMTGYQARPLTAPFRLALSGTPVIKSATDVYPILRWLGAPTGNKQQFLDRFMVQRPRSRELVLADEPGLLSLLDCWRFQVPKSAVLSIPRAWHYERVRLEPWQRSLYQELRRRLRSLDAEELAGSQLEQLLRLAQITAGFDGQDPPSYVTANAKLTHLMDKVLPSVGEDQAVIWVRFRKEALGVLDALRRNGWSAVAFTGAHTDDINADSFRSFAGGSSQFFVATLAKGAMGLNLPMAAHMVYLTRDFDTEGWVQSLDRNHRLSTSHQALNVTVIEAQDSIDQKITQVLGDDLHEAARLTALDVREVLGR